MVKLDKDLLKNASDKTNSLVIDLSQQEIDDLDENLFSNSESITILNMSNNKIVFIPKEFFNGSTNLKYLNLSFNFLESFESEILEYLPNLKVLNLNNNKIESFNLQNEQIHLEEIYLNNNKIKSFSNKFNKLSLIHLRKLELFNNNLDDFDASLLSYSKDLHVLKLEISNLISFNYEQLPFNYKQQQEKIIKDCDEKIDADSLFIGNLYEALSARSEEKAKKLLSNYHEKISSMSEKVAALNELTRICIKKNNLKIFRISFEELRSLNGTEINFKLILSLLAQYDENASMFSFLSNLFRFENDKENLKALKIACLHNQHIFLQSFLAELSSQDWHTVELIKESCKHIKCFQIFYFINRNACFKSNDILKHCLDNKYMETFWFILEQMNENELMKKLIKSNLDWKNDSKTLIHIILEDKKYSNQEIMSVFQQLYELNLFNSLFFQANNGEEILNLISSNEYYIEILKYLLEKDDFLNTMKKFRLKINPDNIIINNCFENNLILKLCKDENQLLKENISLNAFEMLCKRNEISLFNYFINYFVDQKFQVMKQIIYTVIKNNNRELIIKFIALSCFKTDHEFVYSYLEEFFNAIFQYNNKFADGIELITTAYEIYIKSLKNIEQENSILLNEKEKRNKNLMRLFAYKVIIKKYPLVLSKMTNEGKSLKDCFLSDNEEKKNVMHIASENCESYETFSILFDHFLSESNFLNEHDRNGNTPLDVLISREKENKTYYFSFSFIVNIIEKSFKIYDELEIKFKSFQMICNRKEDSNVNKIKLIEYLIGKIKYSDKEEQDIAVHYLITNKNTINIYSNFLLKRLIENQTKEFKFKLKNESFKALLNREELDLFKIFIERGYFLEENPISSFDILLQQQKNNVFIFSNVFIKKLNENSTIFKLGLNFNSFLNICQRNESKLIEKYKDNFNFREQDLTSCIQSFIRYNNLETAKYAFELLQIKNFNLKNFFVTTIKLSIQSKEFNIAEYFISKALNEDYIFDSDSFITYVLNKDYINYLLEQKIINKDLIEKANKFLKDGQNILHFAGINYSSNMFLDLISVTLTIPDERINNYLNIKCQEDKTPFDYATMRYIYDECEKSFIEKIVYRLTNNFKLKISRESFIIILEKKNEINLESVKLLIEKSLFDSFLNETESPIDLLIEHGYTSLFIKQINLKSDIFKENYLILSDKSLEIICISDFELFQFLFETSKNQTNLFMRKLNKKKQKCLDYLKKINDPNQHLILKYFFNFGDSSRFGYVKESLKTATDETNFQLTKFVLEYLKENKNELIKFIEENPTDHNMFDHQYIKKICDSRQWQLIELILDCSYINENEESKFFLTHFDFEQELLANNSNSCYIDIDKEPIQEIKQHILYRIAESGQKHLIDHPTIATHLKYKWEKIPRTFYYIVTLVKLFYLILFSWIVLVSLNRRNELKKFEINIIIKIILLVLWLIFFIYEIFQIIIEKHLYFLYNFKLNNNEKKLNLKNISEIVSILFSFLVLLILFDIELITKSISMDFRFKVISYITPLCIIFRYIEFLLCLEKINKIGIYIVAFRQSFEKSLLLLPLIMSLLCGFIISFKIGTNSINETFFNSTILESVAHIENMLIANIADIDKLGMKSNYVITNYILYSLFVLLVPILLINLLIGVTTGQLDEVLDSSEMIQFGLKATYSLQMQRIFLKNFKWKKFQSRFLVPDVVKNKAFKSYNQHIQNEFTGIKTEINLLKNNLKHNSKDLLLNINELNGKLKNLQDDILEEYKESDKKTILKLEEFEKKFVSQIDSLVLELN